MKQILFSIFYFLLLIHGESLAQSSLLVEVQSGRELLPNVTLEVRPLKLITVTDSMGTASFNAIPPGRYSIHASMAGYTSEITQIITQDTDRIKRISIHLTQHSKNLEEVVITGTLKEVKRSESPVPVEVYSPAFFRKNPTPSVFEALQNINGVRPQLNCNICNTGDVHINGLEGPYTMVLIDGMPIVSSLATVYGLSGIPNSMIDRIEVVKGPASSLYGSEAVGGLINIITKKVVNAPLLSVDMMATSWKELNTDLGFKFKAGNNAAAITGINYFLYDEVTDNNNDRFTDVTLQNRFSLFQKWNFKRTANRIFNLAGRYMYEDRWGGDVRWNKTFRGGDSIYGESIYTRRHELFGNYQLRSKNKLMISFSYTGHAQDSRYGLTSYIAKQHIAFTQLTLDHQKKKHDLLAGMALRYTVYDDNTVATAYHPERTWLPGIFLQDEIAVSSRHKLLLGARYDYNSIHGNIFTPRFAWKWTLPQHQIVRLNAGTGFRVVNLFTEDHAALTGARSIEIRNKLKPERSYNFNLNYNRKIFNSNGWQAGIDITTWYTYFSNRIFADYEAHPNKIIYDNLKGYAISKGVSTNIDLASKSGLKINAGASYMDVFTVKEGIRSRQILTEKITGTWAISYKLKKLHLLLDYTGNIYGPMRLPLLGKLDPRRAYSPVWSIQNIQLQFTGIRRFDIYAGVKNLLNWTPSKGNPFLIARSDDPFDTQVEYDASGNIKPTPSNPFALSFDPSYVFAPNQGIRIFMGCRFNIL